MFRSRTYIQRFNQGNRDLDIDNGSENPDDNEKNNKLKKGKMRKYFMSGSVAICIVLIITVLFLQSQKQKNNYASSIAKISSSATSSTIVECSLKTVTNSTSAKDVLHITLLRDIAPLASDAFIDLVNAKYYDGVFVFRVLKGFIAQWGFRPKWDDKKFQPKPRSKINDDVVEGKSLSNTRGTLTFAGNSNVQVFINLGDNSRLDNEGGRPFAILSPQSMEVADSLCSDYKDGAGQIVAIKNGIEAVKQQFPCMSQIQSCRVVD